MERPWGAGNDLGAEGAASLAPALARLTHLVSLSLNCKPAAFGGLVDAGGPRCDETLARMQAMKSELRGRRH